MFYKEYILKKVNGWLIQHREQAETMEKHIIQLEKRINTISDFIQGKMHDDINNEFLKMSVATDQIRKQVDAIKTYLKKQNLKAKTYRTM